MTMYINSKHENIELPSAIRHHLKGRKLRVQGKEDPGETSCFFCTKPKSRPTSAATVKSSCSTVLLSSPTVLLYPRFNEVRPSSRKECRPRRLTIDGRQTPLAMECWQTNIKNHQMNQVQAEHTNSNVVVTRTVLEDRSYLNRTASLPILLEKKSVEMKPRYEPKKSIRKRIPSKKEEKVEQPTKYCTTVKSTDQPADQKPVGSEKVIDHSISVIITDKRTRAVVRASSASRSRALQRKESIEF